MSKKTVAFVITIFLILLGGLLVYYFFFLKSELPGTGEIGREDTETSLFPFGDEGGATEIKPTDQGKIETTVAPKERPRLWQVANVPVAGATIFDGKDGATIRYVERATGHIYEVKAETGTPRRVTNTTIPKIYEALWFNSESVILRYLKEGTESIESFFAKVVLPKSASSQAATSAPSSQTAQTGSLEGAFLPRGIGQLAVSPKKDKIFYLAESNTGISGIIANPDGTKKVETWTSPLRGWLISWPEAQTISLTVKPTASAPGFLYFLNSRSGSLSKILGGINGLTTLASPDAKQILYSQSGRSGIDTFLLDVKNNTTVIFPLRTLPEKCVWSKKDNVVIYCAAPQTLRIAELPDLWYQGLVSFDDDIWSINTETGSTELIASPGKLLNGKTLDITSIALNESEQYLLFSNKKDLTLWLLKIK